MVDHRRIVLTGGPGGGKTTLMHELRARDPEAKRWAFVPEATPLVFRAGLDARDPNFQATVLAYQLELEATGAAQAGPGQVLVCHWGTLDLLAYWLSTAHASPAIDRGVPRAGPCRARGCRVVRASQVAQHLGRGWTARHRETTKNSDNR